ncbi:HAD family phosphatase [Pseudomonas sp. GX19020]|uniref:HAD family hydrolase n=1 Tax=Pseudomonas sp. GX19020 TaxID=2942277 RepID=UPI0020196AD0|nr:HAD family phosphatase [Pseudomonas sp. GX19020]MCL4066308.1 HAD family phosphatase [Pseudomonas sp. GX19020]
MTPPAAVLFDCDGVIVDSEGPTFQIMLAEFASCGFHLTLEELERDYIGGTVEDVASRARANGADLPESWVADLYANMYAMLEAGVPLIPDILQVFDRLDAAGIPYAVGSNGSPEKMQITLGARGLIPRFRTVLSGQAIGRPKPLPDLYLACAKACGVAPEACVVIEDSPAGARAAIAAGIPCLGFAAHGEDTPPARGLKALNVPLFHSMKDLPGLLGL